MGITYEPEEIRRMTSGEKMTIHVIFVIGVVMLLVARIIYLDEQLKKCVGPGGTGGDKTGVVAVVNGPVTNKSNPFLTGLKSGFESGLDSGLEKDKGKEKK